MKIGNIKDLPLTKAAHGPYQKQILVSEGEVSNLYQLGRVVMKKGQFAAMHSHDGMSEIQIIEKGKAVVKFGDGEAHEVSLGGYIVTNPDEKHEISNPFDEDLVLTFFEIRS